jgi:hypothetical protein
MDSNCNLIIISITFKAYSSATGNIVDEIVRIIICANFALLPAKDRMSNNILARLQVWPPHLWLEILCMPSSL